jgi:hypothetical protein
MAQSWLAILPLNVRICNGFSRSLSFQMDKFAHLSYTRGSTAAGAAAMDADAFFNRLKQRVAELEAGGKRISPDIKKTIRQRPQHGYRLDSLERLAEALDWSVPELLAGIWQMPLNLVKDAVPFGLKCHVVCLNFARERYVVNQLMPPAAEERRLENRVAELYQQWIELERATRRSIDAETITVYWGQIEREVAHMVEELRVAEAAHPPEQPEDPSAPEKKAATDDEPPLNA